jgi:hypothetical protein
VLNDSVVNGRVPNNREVLTGTTVHVVPVEGGLWQVVDKLRHIFTCRSKTAALKQAKSIAAANPPSQVVLLDELARLVPVAHYQLPQYRPLSGDEGNRPRFEAAVKALLISDLLSAGVAVLSDVVDKADRELARVTSKPISPRRKVRR